MECETTGSYDCVDGRSPTTHTPREKKKKQKNKEYKKKNQKEILTFEVFGEAGIVASMKSFMEDFSVSFGFEYSTVHIGGRGRAGQPGV